MFQIKVTGTNTRILVVCQSDDMLNFFVVLGFTKDTAKAASQADIRKAYKRLSKIVHPDKHLTGGGGQPSLQIPVFQFNGPSLRTHLWLIWIMRNRSTYPSRQCGA